MVENRVEAVISKVMKFPEMKQLRQYGVKVGVHLMEMKGKLAEIKGATPFEKAVAGVDAVLYFAKRDSMRLPEEEIEATVFHLLLTVRVKVMPDVGVQVIIVKDYKQVYPEVMQRYPDSFLFNDIEKGRGSLSYYSKLSRRSRSL